MPGFNAYTDKNYGSFIALDALVTAEPTLSGCDIILSYGCMLGSCFSDCEGVFGGKGRIGIVVDHILKSVRQQTGFEGIIAVYTDNDIILKSTGYKDILKANNSELSAEFRALTVDLQRKLSAPVTSTDCR